MVIFLRWPRASAPHLFLGPVSVSEDYHTFQRERRRGFQALEDFYGPLSALENGVRRRIDTSSSVDYVTHGVFSPHAARIASILCSNEKALGRTTLLKDS
jgi:hypothetical protein